MGLFMAFCRRAAKLARLLRDCTFRAGLRHGVAASLENMPVMRSLQVRAVIDAGANIGQFSLLKIDVQGGELALLEGAEGLLPWLDHVYVKPSFKQFYQGQPLAGEIIDHLRERVYRLTGIGGTARDAQGMIVQADLLFSRLASQ